MAFPAPRCLEIGTARSIGTPHRLDESATDVFAQWRALRHAAGAGEMSPKKPPKTQVCNYRMRSGRGGNLHRASLDSVFVLGHPWFSALRRSCAVVSPGCRRGGRRTIGGGFAYSPWCCAPSTSCGIGEPLTKTPPARSPSYMRPCAPSAWPVLPHAPGGPHAVAAVLRVEDRGARAMSTAPHGGETASRPGVCSRCVP